MSEQSGLRDAGVPGEPELFDFGPEVERPAQGPRAVLPPWMTSAAAPEVDVTPEPRAVPGFARAVPAPRRRRRAEPDIAVIAAPDVCDVPLVAAPAAAPADAPAAPPPAAAEPAAAEPAAAGSAAAEPAAAEPAAAGSAAAEPAARRLRWARIGQALAVLGLGTAIGISVTGGLSFLSERGELRATAVAAGAWVKNNVPADASVLVPAALSETLLAAGRDPGTLYYYAGNASDEALVFDSGCCEFVVVTDGAPAGPVAELVDRSRPAASFTGDGSAEVRQVLPGSPAKVSRDIAAEREALIATGKQLMSTDQVEVSGAARAQILAGTVDPRVLLAIVAVALEHEITIADFPAGPGESAAGILRRAVTLSTIDGEDVAGKTPEFRAVRNLLAGQTGVFKPAGAEVRTRDGVDVLEFGFAAPSPFGIFALDE